MVVLLERGVACSSNVKHLLPRAAEYISFQRRRFLISSLGTFNSRRPLAKLSKPGGGPGLLLFVFLGSLSHVTWVTKSTMLVPGMGTPLVINWPDALSHPSIPPGLLEIIFNRALALSGTPLGRALATGPITSSASFSSSSSLSSSSPSSSDGGTDGRAVGKALCWSRRRAAVSWVSSFAVLYLRASSSAAAPLGRTKTSSNSRRRAVILSTLGSDMTPPGRKGSCWASSRSFLFLVVCPFLEILSFLFFFPATDALAPFSFFFFFPLLPRPEVEAWTLLMMEVLFWFFSSFCNRTGSTRANFFTQGSLCLLLWDDDEVGMSLTPSSDQARQCRDDQWGHCSQQGPQEASLLGQGLPRFDTGSGASYGP